MRFCTKKYFRHIHGGSTLYYVKSHYGAITNSQIRDPTATNAHAGTISGMSMLGSHKILCNVVIAFVI